MMVAEFKKKQIGFTLIEIMISFLLGLIVIGGILTIYIASIRGSSDTIKSARLNYDLDSVMSLMINDIRRAGYWGGALTGANSKTNPFMTASTDIIISEKTGEDGDSCILYTYDANNSGANTLTDITDDVDLNEYYGFRLNGDGIDIRYSVDDAANTSCDDDNWEQITFEDKVIINSLTFSNSAYQCLNASTNTPYNSTCAQVITDGNLTAGQSGVETRELNITLTGTVKNDGNVQKTLTGNIKVRNNRVFDL